MAKQKLVIAIDLQNFGNVELNTCSYGNQSKFHSVCLANLLTDCSKVAFACLL